MSSKSRILVTGASGFIGKHVLRRLRNENAEIILLVRNGVQLSDLKEYFDKVIEIDISDIPKDIFEITGNPDVLIHLAWDGLPNYQSLHHYEKELPRQYTFLKTMILGGLKTLVITGTCFEYGMQEGCLYEDQFTKPDNPYGFAKDSLHRQLLYLSKETSFNLAWCRLFYMWGEGQSEQSLYSQLKTAVSRGDDSFNMSEGEQLRDYLPVQKVAEYLVQISKENQSTTTVNIASGKPISVKKLVENWIETNQWKIKLNLGFYPYSSFEAMEFWGDISNLNILLNHD